MIASRFKIKIDQTKKRKKKEKKMQAYLKTKISHENCVHTTAWERRADFCWNFRTR